MFDSLKKYKNILIVALVIAVAFVAYSMFFAGKTDTGGILSSSSVGGGKENVINNELLVLLVNLKSIRLNDQIFSDPAFGRLQDFGRELISEPSGRDNPFSPVGSGGF